MHPCSPCHAPKSRGGFTLIELLVVVAIIGILAAILSSVMGRAQYSARKVQVINDMRNLRVATNSYWQDYHHLPLNQQQLQDVKSDTVFGDPDGQYKNRDFIDVLRAISDGSHFNSNNELNPNKVVYWEGQMAKNSVKPTNGITTVEYKTARGERIEKGSFIDSFGYPYVIWVDANQDGDLGEFISQFYHDIKKGDVPVRGEHAGIEFSSLGSDGTFGTNGNKTFKGSDDIMSSP